MQKPPHSLRLSTQSSNGVFCSLGQANSTNKETNSGKMPRSKRRSRRDTAASPSCRARAPVDWASTQNNLGNALRKLGERERGTARLEEAVVAFREALRENTRARVPLSWAKTQNNLGSALFRLGERESETARLEEAVAAFREALQERTRARVPLLWARTQMSLGV